MSRQVILNYLSNPIYSPFKSIREMLTPGDWRAWTSPSRPSIASVIAAPAF
jgi:hypothetical protein